VVTSDNSTSISTQYAAITSAVLSYMQHVIKVPLQWLCNSLLLKRITTFQPHRIKY